MIVVVPSFHSSQLWLSIACTLVGLTVGLTVFRSALDYGCVCSELSERLFGVKMPCLGFWHGGTLGVRYAALDIRRQRAPVCVRQFRMGNSLLRLHHMYVMDQERRRTKGLCIEARRERIFDMKDAPE